jgi:hypothetical protein
MFRLRSTPLVSALVLASLAGCSSTGKQPMPYEDFGSSGKYSRSFSAPGARTCEAARRALLSQGYVIVTATPELVNGRKSFQPEKELHVEVDVRAVCAPEVGRNDHAIVFVTAQQDRYALKKSNSAASVGVGAIGSLSLPFTSGSDSLVKVASETISVGEFYDRFFKLLGRYLAGPSEPGRGETLGQGQGEGENDDTLAGK